MDWDRFCAALCLLAALTIGGSGLSAAEKAQPLELAAPFVDDAVLQREMKVPVWGWAAPGGKVTVAFAGQTKCAAADG